MQSFSSNKRPKLGKAQAHMGRTLQSRPLLLMRQLPPRNSRWTKTPSPMEHRKLEEVPPVNVLDEFVLEINRRVSLLMSLYKADPATNKTKKSSNKIPL